MTFLNLKELNAQYKDDLYVAAKRVIDSGWYILGEEVDHFEQEFADYCGVEYCVGVSNGLDALSLIFQSCLYLEMLKNGDEILLPANTFIASALAISENNLIPVFVEPRRDTYNIDIVAVERSITSRTRAILAVHLYGCLADMEALKELAEKYNLFLIEDCAQAHGAQDVMGNRAGSFSVAAAFSFYPGKNLGALGDGGAITTSDTRIRDVVRKLRNYGSSDKYHFDIKGGNKRLDEIQAAFLRVKLKNLDREIKIRREMASFYLDKINNNKITLPLCEQKCTHVWHLFVVMVEQRESFLSHLRDNSIDSPIHYPVPIHKQKSYSEYHDLSLPITEDIQSKILSLPLYPTMSRSCLENVIDSCNSF